MKALVAISFLGFLLFSVKASFAQEKSRTDAAALAKKLSNPVASLISIPFQNNLDIGVGANNGSRNTLNIQPVIPVKLSYNLNLITRVVLPVVSQYDIYANNTHQYGLGDALVSAFFSLSKAKNGITCGVGPILLIPTAADGILGANKFGIGPTGVILKQTGAWTYGALANQVWSVAGNQNISNINQMFVQPFVSYNFTSGAGIAVNAEMTQNWKSNHTTIFINPAISALTRFGSQTVSILIGPRFNVVAPSELKSALGVRAAITFIFPK